MTPIYNTAYYSEGFFKQSRCSFDDDDLNETPQKMDVRCHNKFTAFFLRCFGKIEVVWDETHHKKAYLNRNSYIKQSSFHSKASSFDQSMPSSPSEDSPQIHESVSPFPHNSQHNWFPSKLPDISKKLDGSAKVAELSISSTSTETSRLTERKIRAQEFVDGWMDGHRENFVAHAIFDDKNVKFILQDGRIAPAEHTLREKKLVEYEVGMNGQRGIAQLPELGEEEIAALKHIESKFNIGQPFGAVLKLQMFEDAWDLIFGCDSVLIWAEYVRTLQSLATKYQVPSVCIAIAYDLSKPENERIDFWLHQYYLNLPEEYKKEIENNPKEKEHFNTQMLEVRRRTIPVTKVNHDIRVASNIIWWSYGNTVVMRGDARQVIHHIDTTATERSLLEPWENGGALFCLDLSESNTFVLGPKNTLKPHKTLAEEKNIQLIYIEDLSKEQMEFFRVPENLR